MADTTQTSGNGASSAAQGSASTTNPSADSAQATNGQQQYVTKAELEAFQTSLKESQQAQSSILGGIQNTLKKLTEGKAAPVETKTEDTSLTARVAAVETSEKALRDSMKFGALKAAAMAKGVTEARAEQFARFVQAEHPNKITTTKDFRVVFQESDDKSTGITDWVTAYLQTADGEMFLPPVAAGSGSGQSRSGKTAAAAPQASMTYEQLMADIKSPETAAWCVEHAAEFEAKRQQRKK